MENLSDGYSLSSGAKKARTWLGDDVRCGERDPKEVTQYGVTPKGVALEEIPSFWREMDSQLLCWGYLPRDESTTHRMYYKPTHEKITVLAPKPAPEPVSKVAYYNAAFSSGCRCWPDHVSGCIHYREPDGGRCTGCRGGCSQCGQWA